MSRDIAETRTKNGVSHNGASFFTFGTANFSLFGPEKGTIMIVYAIFCAVLSKKLGATEYFDMPCGTMKIIRVAMYDNP